MSLTGKEFKEQYGTKFYKWLKKDLIHYNFKYELGLNVDTNEFIPTTDYSNGFYFADIKNILSFCDYCIKSNIGIIEIPDDAIVGIRKDCFKTNKLELKQILINDLDILEIVKEAHTNGYVLDRIVCMNAADNGRLEVLKYAHKNGCTWDEYTCNVAAENGHLEVLKWLHSLSSKEDREDKPQTLPSPLVTVEFARLHENGCPWSTETCAAAARGKQLETLKWLHSLSSKEDREDKPQTLPSPLVTVEFARLHENGCPWNERTSFIAASTGILEILKYAHENRCPWDEQVCASAALMGHLEVVKYAHENGCPWTKWTCINAACNGHLEVLKYLHENNCPWDEQVCVKAAEYGQLEVLKYLHEKGCPWDKWTCNNAIINGELDTLKYAYENGCPLEKLVHYDANSNYCDDYETGDIICTKLLCSYIADDRYLNKSNRKLDILKWLRESGNCTCEGKYH
jgi:hypothetical protein